VNRAVRFFNFSVMCRVRKVLKLGSFVWACFLGGGEGGTPDPGSLRSGPHMSYSTGQFNWCSMATDLGLQKGIVVGRLSDITNTDRLSGSIMEEISSGARLYYINSYQKCQNCQSVAPSIALDEEEIYFDHPRTYLSGIKMMGSSFAFQEG
jgi:hypothetical protein